MAGDLDMAVRAVRRQALLSRQPQLKTGRLNAFPGFTGVLSLAR
jgi:hypothetical protein